MQACLIRIEARRTDGTLFVLRAGSVDDYRLCHLGGWQWDPAIWGLPTLSYDFFGGAFQSAIAAPEASFALALPALASMPATALADVRFAGAGVEILRGALGDDLTGFATRFAGRIAAEPDIREGVAQFTAAPDDRWLDNPLLARYAGTGGIEGPDDLAGVTKPLVLGRCKFVPAVLLDPVDNVYQINGYGPVEAIPAAFDRLASLGPAMADHADLAALLAADIPEGRWATCLAQGLVRLGWPADGKLSFHVDGDNSGPGGFVRSAGAMLGRIAALAGGSTNSANLAALDAARPWPLAVRLGDQTTARDVVQELADSVAAVAGIGWAGEFFVQALGLTAPSFVLDAGGRSEPLVSEVAQMPIGTPFWRLATSAAPTWLVHDQAEIATGYIQRGLWTAARTYRLDDLVFADDGRAFAYINATPSAGNAPPLFPAVANDYWALVGAADVTSQSQITLDPVNPVLISADPAGVTITTLPVLRRVVIRKGDVDVSAGATFAVTGLPGGITATLGTEADHNLLSITAVAAGGSVEVTATLAAQDYTALVQVTRTQNPPAAAGGSGYVSPVHDFSWDNVSTTSFVPVTMAGLEIRSDASGHLFFSFAAAYDGNEFFRVEAKAQYSLDATSWSDFAAAVQGSEVSVNGRGIEIPGFITGSGTNTGLSASTDYFVRLVARRSQGTGASSFFDSNFTVRHP